MAKYCANCGRELPDEAMYCPDCGRKFIPRYKADYSDFNNNSEGSSSSDYEFNGPFGPSDKEFEGPFGPHSNRGSYDSHHSLGNKSSSSSSNGSKGSENASNVPSKDSIISQLGFGKVCLIVFVALLLLSLATTLYQEHNSNDYDPTIFTDSANSLYDNGNQLEYQDSEGMGSIKNNEPYYMSIDKDTYISGKGEVRLIDSNHSYNIESEEFNITEYETYYVNVDGNDWYVLDVFKCKFDTPAQSQVYSTDMDDGDPIIIYCGKGDYYGYGIIMPNSSDNSTYKNIGFLESIFHYRK